jgi:hypothetical protein
MATQTTYRNGWRAKRHPVEQAPETSSGSFERAVLDDLASAQGGTPAWVRGLNPVDEAEMSIAFGGDAFAR